MSTNAVGAKITDSLLLIAHENDKRLHEELNGNLSRLDSEFQSLEKSAKDFGADVGDYFLALEEKRFEKNKLDSPSAEVLKEKEQIALCKYWKLVADCKRINAAVTKILGANILFCPPRYDFYQNSYGINDEFSLQLSELSRLCNELGEGIMTDSKKLQARVVALGQSLKDEIATSCVRFCKIVDNGGKPIGWIAARVSSTGGLFYPTVSSPKKEIQDRYPDGNFPPLCDFDPKVSAALGITKPKTEETTTLIAPTNVPDIHLTENTFLCGVQF